MRALLFVILLLMAKSVHAESDSSETTNVGPSQFFINGQNLTSTSDILEPGHCFVGLELIACGVADRFSLGTSTWMYADYNMYSLAGRYLIDDDHGRRWAIQTTYFETYRDRDAQRDGPGFNYGTYEMRALWIMFIRTLPLAPHYRLHLNLHTNYYWDEKMPFSLRRPYATGDHKQFTLSTLSEIQLVAGWFLLGEFGFLDMTRAPLHVHTGISLGWGNAHISGHIGFTMTGTGQSFFKPTSRLDDQQSLRETQPQGYYGDLSAYNLNDDFSVHPEFSLGYQF